MTPTPSPDALPQATATAMAVTTPLPMPPFAHGAAFSGFGLRDPGLQPALDPLLSLDHFWMSEPTFAPHPHAGFSAVTYLFDDSETAFVNTDSLGHCVDIAPGDLHWTLSGSGLMHEEVPRLRGRRAHGLQIFVNLPAAEKLQPPAIFHVDAAQMPVQAGAGVEATLVFGRLGELASPLQPAGDASLVDVRLAPQASFDLTVPAGSDAVVLVISGTVTAGVDGTVLTPQLGGASVGPAGGGMLNLRSGDAPCRLVLFTGVPVREPIVWGGPFVMNTTEQITDAKRRFAAGAMGRLSP